MANCIHHVNFTRQAEAGRDKSGGPAPGQVLPQELTAPFDYAAMAGEAKREMEALRERRRQRLDQGPQDGEPVMAWERDNRLIYQMYLEQRKVWLELSKRADWRQRRQGKAAKISAETSAKTSAKTSAREGREAA